MDFEKLNFYVVTYVVPKYVVGHIRLSDLDQPVDAFLNSPLCAQPVSKTGFLISQPVDEILDENPKDICPFLGKKSFQLPLAPPPDTRPRIYLYEGNAPLWGFNSY